MNPGGSNNDLYSQIGPGFAAFVVIFTLALAVWFLVRSMNSHLRRVRYAQAAEEAQLRADVQPGEGGPGRDRSSADGSMPPGDRRNGRTSSAER